MNSYKLSLYTGIIRIAANLAMLGALFLGMHQAARWRGWSSETVFCLVFFGITIPVWIAALYLTRRLRKSSADQEQSLVRLPRLGESLVAWRVAEERPLFAARDARGA